MKPLSFSAAAAAILLLLCTSFRSGTEGLAPKKSLVSSDNTHYYYYLNGGTTYDGWYTIAEETDRMSDMYGVYVDTDPFGGTLLASGYSLKGIPHLVYATSFLYGH